MEKSQKNCSSIFADPLGVNKIVSESEGETENSEKVNYILLNLIYFYIDNLKYVFNNYFVVPFFSIESSE